MANIPFALYLVTSDSMGPVTVLKPGATEWDLLGQLSWPSCSA